MWDLPKSGIGPVSPVLADRFSSTASPGKSYFHIFLSNCFSISRYCKKPLTSNCTIQIATPGKGKKSTPKPIPILAAGFCSDKMSLLLVYGSWFQPVIERVVRRCSCSKAVWRQHLSGRWWLWTDTLLCLLEHPRTCHMFPFNWGAFQWVVYFNLWELWFFSWSLTQIWTVWIWTVWVHFYRGFSIVSTILLHHPRWLNPQLQNYRFIVSYKWWISIAWKVGTPRLCVVQGSPM